MSIPRTIFLAGILFRSLLRVLFVCCVFNVFARSALFAEAQRFEAEAAILTGTVVSSTASGFSGSGYVRGFSDESDRVAFRFQATEGVYAVTVGYRTPSGEKGFNGALNGVGFSGMFEASSDWRTFDLGVMALGNGENTIWIGGGWSYYEIDYIEIVESHPFARPAFVDPTPVDVLASDDAKGLLAYLSDRYGLLTLSGQQEIEELDVVEGLTGVRPAIVGGDLIEYSPTRVANGSNPNEATEKLIAQHEAGMIVTLSWHWNAPADLVDTAEIPWWKGFYAEGTTFDFAAALDDPQGADYQLILRDIDAIAVELKKLQAAEVPVLWRPLHESDGGWFWWGTKGADNLRRLWVLLYERLTEHHGIHNLIWVQTIGDLGWYVGDEYVDIVGVDAYPDDPRDPQTAIWKLFLDRFDGKKLIALSEFGRVPDVPTMQRLGVWFSYFMSWSGDLGAGGMSDVQALEAIYTSDAVVSFDELTAPDLDGDGLDRVQEIAYGSSDNKADSNGDGVDDGVSVKIGYNPTTNLAGMAAFYSAEKRGIEVWSSDGALLAFAPLGIRTGLADLERLELSVVVSADLDSWIPFDLPPSSFVDRGDGTAAFRVPSNGDALFVRVSLGQR